MSDLDERIAERLREATAGVTAASGLAERVRRRGRARRLRRYAVGGTAVVVLGLGAAALPTLADGPTGESGPAASGADPSNAAAMAWARSLPRGDAPDLPFFGEGGLRDGGLLVPVPDTVDRVVPPRAVAGGWLVSIGTDFRTLALAVLAPDGSLRELPAYTFPGDSIDIRVEVSADGRTVAYGTWTVDVETMVATEVPHQPASTESSGYSTAVRMLGFTDDGLVYQGAPFDEGWGTLWLLRGDGSSVEVDPPAGTHVSDGSPADLALGFDYAPDDSDTCVTSHRLVAERWVEQGTGCLGSYLGEALAVSPSGRWLLTDDLPRVWDLREGQWAEVAVPREAVRSWGEVWFGRAVWEGDDAFLLPLADRQAGAATPEEPFDQTTQVVRCTMSTGECERAGDEQRVRVTSTMWGSTEVRFATP